MMRMSEEQGAIIECYSGSKVEVEAELRKAIPFIVDAELTELSVELLAKIENMSDDEFALLRRHGMIGI